MPSSLTVRSSAFALLVVVCVGPQLAQQSNTAPSTVVSIKPSDAGNDPGGFRMTGGTFIAHRVNVKLLVAIAYGVQPYQVSGGPAWADTERFDVEAKPDGPENPDRDESAMLKALLSDRFKLVLHKDESQTSAFALVVAEKGPRMKLSTDQSPGAGPLSGVHVSPGNLMGHGMRLGLVASLLGTRLGRPVVDKTNLPDRYDIDLKWSPDVGELPAGATDTPPQPDPSRPSLFTRFNQSTVWLLRDRHNRETSRKLSMWFREYAQVWIEPCIRARLKSSRKISAFQGFSPCG